MFYPDFFTFIKVCYGPCNFYDPVVASGAESEAFKSPRERLFGFAVHAASGGGFSRGNLGIEVPGRPVKAAVLDQPGAHDKLADFGRGGIGNRMGGEIFECYLGAFSAEIDAVKKRLADF